MVDLNIDENFELITDYGNPTTLTRTSDYYIYLRRLIERNEIVGDDTFFKEVLAESIYEGMEEATKEDLIKENIYNFYKEQCPEIRNYLVVEVVCIGTEKLIFYMDTQGEFILSRKYIKYYSEGSAK